MKKSKYEVKTFQTFKSICLLELKFLFDSLIVRYCLAPKISSRNFIICSTKTFWSHCFVQGKAGHEIQSSTLELINGLVSLVHQPSMPDVALEAMEALLVLHQPDKIEMWNPEAPINTFWDVSSQVGSSEIVRMLT